VKDGRQELLDERHHGRDVRAPFIGQGRRITPVAQSPHQGQRFPAPVRHIFPHALPPGRPGKNTGQRGLGVRLVEELEARWLDFFPPPLPIPALPFHSRLLLLRAQERLFLRVMSRRSSARAMHIRLPLTPQWSRSSSRLASGVSARAFNNKASRSAPMMRSRPPP